MALKLAFNAAKASADAVVSLIDADDMNGGQLIIYDGTEPATPETVLDIQMALAIFALPKPAFVPSIKNGSDAFAEANPVDSVLAIESGTASWFRLVDGDGVAVLQGSVTDTTGTGDVKVSSTSILTGVEVSVLALTYTQPTYTVVS